VNYSNIYNIDFRKFANLLIPPFLRKVVLIDWLVTLLNPVEDVNYKFKKFRDSSIYKVTHNGQVVYLQKVLNDYFDNLDRRIYIVDSLVIPPTWVYPVNENLPVYIYPENENKPVYIYDDSIFIDSGIDFVVILPLDIKPTNATDLNTLEIYMKSLINYYKLASKRYKLEWT